MTDEYDEYDLPEIKPNHSTAFLGMILAIIATFAGGMMTSRADTVEGVGIGQAVMAGGVVGFFIMIGVVAIVSAIYKNR